MIVLDYHTVVQRIVDEWHDALPPQERGNCSCQCTDEHLRMLIVQLENELDEMAVQVDQLRPKSFRGLLRMNWKWICGRVAAIRLFHRHEGCRQ